MPGPRMHSLTTREGRLFAVLTYYSAGPHLEPQPSLRRLTPAEREEAASVLQRAWPVDLTHDEAFAILRKLGMPG